MKSNAAGKTPDQTETTTQGNQLDTGAKAKTLPALTKLGTIGPAKADGTFRDVTFTIPPALVADHDRLVVRLIRPRGKVGALVAEVRLLRD